MEVLKGLLRGGPHHKRGRSVAKTAKLSTEVYIVSRVPLTRGCPRLVRFYFYFFNQTKNKINKNKHSKWVYGLKMLLASRNEN